MSHRPIRTLRKGVSAVIATLMLVAIGIASAIIVFAFVTGLMGNLTATQGLVVESGTLTVPTGGNTGSLVVSVKNTANSPITSITVSEDSGTLSLDASAPGSTWTMFSGTQIPAGTAESAEAPVGPSGSALVAGNSYTFTVTVHFESGGASIQTLTVKAQI